MGRPNCLRSVAYRTDCSSSDSSAPAICAARTIAPWTITASAPTPRAGRRGGDHRRAAEHQRVARLQREIAVARDLAGALAHQRDHRRAVDLGHDDDVAGGAPHGTPRGRPAELPRPPALRESQRLALAHRRHRQRAERHFEPAPGPGASRRGSSRRAAPAPWSLPAARTTTCASAQLPPAPPASSGTSGSVRPPSSSARQSLSGHAPFSADSISSLVTRSLKSRVTVRTRALQGACLGSMRCPRRFIASPSPRAMMPRRISRVPPRSENEGACWTR